MDVRFRQRIVFALEKSSFEEEKAFHMTGKASHDGPRTGKNYHTTMRELVHNMVM